jgi:hypothetical protein
MDSQKAQYLIDLPKKIVEYGTLLERKSIVLSTPFNERYSILSEEDNNYSFFVEVYQSSKNLLKITLHFQEDGANYGLLRIDYGGGGRHKNPEVCNANVPEVCKPYRGQWIDTPHIHFAVEGYRQLAWAIPLGADEFPVKFIEQDTDITPAFSAFLKRINVTTVLMITKQTDAFL